ncbi:hypothetical protein GF407_03555 [candidate division KSB1 bacterium]|nr:hypothetical protein [candidate division KSB1 bacterium]
MNMIRINTHCFTSQRLLLTAVIIMMALSGGDARNNKKEQSLYAVGYKVIDIDYQKNGHAQTLTVAVWYPTAEQPSSHHYGGPTRGNVAVNAEPLDRDRACPFLLFSHGFGGSGIAAVFLTEKLAARGWIVAAPDHHDSHSAVRIHKGMNKFDRRGFFKAAKAIGSSSPQERQQYLYRLDEMQLALDGMLKHALFGRYIDAEKIAVGGHSFGGFTAMGLCGTIAERHDERIRAVLLYSTGAAGYLYTEEELQDVEIPSMLFMGERERKQKRGDKTMAELSDKIYSSLAVPKYFAEVRGGTHLSFNNRFSNRPGARLMSGNEKQYAVIRTYSIAFLHKYVDDDHNADKVLQQNHAMLTRYVKETKSDQMER